MCNTWVCGQFLFTQKPDNFCCSSTCLRDRFRNILWSLTGSTEIYTGWWTFDRAKLGMCFRKEIIGIHAGSQHRRKMACGRIRLNCSSKHNQIGINGQLLSKQQIRPLYTQFFPFRCNFANHTFNIMYAEFFHSTPIKFIKILTRGTHIDVKYIHLRIRIFISY